MTVLRILILWLVSFSCHAVTASSYIVTDVDGTVLLEKDADAVRSIASISKLVTVNSALHLDGDEMITITKDDWVLARSSTPLRIGKSYSRSTLMNLAIVSSDNVAALALARTEELSHPDTIEIHEGSGLNPQNRSTARALSEYARSLSPELAALSVQPTVTVGKVTRRSTNPLLTLPGWNFHLSKTGFIGAAGGCLVASVNVADRIITFVILGSRDVPARWRDLIELRRMIDDSKFADLTKLKTKSRYRGR